MKRTAALLLLIVIGCGDRPKGPVPIETGDMCAQCRMAISQKRFPAEGIDTDGNVYKFDDIGCLRAFLRRGERAHTAQQLFVTAYDDVTWVNARTAVYVQSASIPSPMASGLLACADRRAAEADARRFGGRILTFAELFEP